MSAGEKGSGFDAGAYHPSATGLVAPTSSREARDRLGRLMGAGLEPSTMRLAVVLLGIFQILERQEEQIAGLVAERAKDGAA